jgi:hypothetical protein
MSKIVKDLMLNFSQRLDVFLVKHNIEFHCVSKHFINNHTCVKLFAIKKKFVSYRDYKCTTDSNQY